MNSKWKQSIYDSNEIKKKRRKRFYIENICYTVLVIKKKIIIFCNLICQ